MRIIQANAIKERFQVAIVVSQFNSEVTSLLVEGALARLAELEVSDITVVYVPGAVELPITAQRLAQTDQYDVIICLGAVIRGETTHYDYVCEQASQGCQRVALDFDIPVIFGVLTTENDEQAMARVGGEHGHKGRDAADAAMQMLSVLHQLNE